MAEGGSKKSHSPAIPSASTPQPRSYDVKVFVGDPPIYLFSVPEWEARDNIKRRDAEVLNSGTRQRGIRLVPKLDIHEQQDSRLATLEQVEGLPVAGRAIRLFYGKRKKAA